MLHLILDATEYLADPWCWSHRFRALKDFLVKTRSRLTVLAPTEVEVRARASELITERCAAIAKALNSAAAFGLNLAQMDLDTLAQTELERWSLTRAAYLEGVAKHIEPTMALLPELVRRLAHRVPPSSARGEEARDALLWLELLTLAGSLAHPDSVAFVSSNTRDFADSDSATLKQQLQAELKALPVEVTYFPSLAAFLQAHADPVAHIDLQWVKDRVDPAQLGQLARDWLSENPEGFARSALDDIDYEVEQVVSIDKCDVTITDVRPWRYASGVIEVTIFCLVEAEGEGECARMEYDPTHTYPATATLAIWTEIGLVIPAKVVDNAVVLGSVEDTF